MILTYRIFTTERPKKRALGPDRHTSSCKSTKSSKYLMEWRESSICAPHLEAGHRSYPKNLMKEDYCNIISRNKKDDVRCVSVDIQEMAPINGINIIQGDITRKETSDQILKLFIGNKADLVVCDGAPDVTGFHELDQYLQAQLVLAALSITTQLIKKNGTFIAKIFRGKEINFLYAQCKIFFSEVYCAKPKSSRNSSYESFVVCKGYKFEKEIPPLLGQMSEIDKEWESTVKFVTCGDLNDYDSDKSYSFGEYEVKGPVQHPINPPYYHEEEKTKTIESINKPK